MMKFIFKYLYKKKTAFSYIKLFFKKIKTKNNLFFNFILNFSILEQRYAKRVLCLKFIFLIIRRTLKNSTDNNYVYTSRGSYDFFYKKFMLTTDMTSLFRKIVGVRKYNKHLSKKNRKFYILKSL